MAFRRGALALAVLLATSAACSSSGDAPPADVVIKPNVHVLDAASLARIKTISAEGTIAFDGHDRAIDGLAAGDVVAGGIAAATPSGLLRRVTHAARTDAGVTLETKAAALTDAIERGKVHLVRPLVSADVKPADLAGSLTGFYVGVNDLVLYENGYGRVTANGSVSAEPSLDLDLDIDLGGIQGLSFTIGGTQAVALDLAATAGVSFDERKDVATYNFVPITIFVGEVPLVFLPRLVFEVGANGTFQAKSTVSVVEQAHAKVGLAYEGGSFSPIADVTRTLSVGTPTVGASATVKAWAGARAELFLYGELGPYGTLEGYLRLAADTNSTPCWKLDAGVASRFGLKVDVFGLNLVNTNTPVFDESKTFASGDCGTPVVGEPLPWAYAYQRVGGDHATAVDAMPDGGLVLAGDASSDASVMRLGKDGAILWQRSYPNGVVATAVRARGNFVFVGGSSWVAKLDAQTGAIVWSYRYGSDPEVRAIEATADGGCVVVGLTVSPQLDFDYWFAKLDANGVVSWSNRMGDAKWEQVNAVRALAGGGYALAGQYAPNQNADAFFARLDDAGNVTLQKRYAGTGTFESFDAVLPTSDGGFALVGRAQRPAGGSGWAVKVDGAGGVVWSKAFGETGSDYLDALVPNATGFLATGSTGTLPSSAWAVALDGTGHPIWSRSYSAVDATKRVEGRGLSVLSDGSFSFAGTTDAFGDSNALALHVTYDGQIDFAPTSGMKMTSLSGSSEAPYPAPAVTTTSTVAAYPVARVAVPITPGALAATATKLSK